MKSKIHEHKKNNIKVVSKKLILSICLLTCLNVFSQETYVYKGNGRVLDSKGTEVSPEQMRSLLADNVKALELYNAGRSKKTLGNVMIIGGLSAEIGWLAAAMTSANNVSTTPGFIFGAIFIAGIPIKIGYSNKVKKAVDLMNENPPKAVGFIESYSIIINQNGVGIALKF